MEYEQIMYEIINGLSGDTEVDIKYLQYKGAIYRNHRYAKEIRRAIDKLSLEMLPDELKNQYRLGIIGDPLSTQTRYLTDQQTTRSENQYISKEPTMNEPNKYMSGERPSNTREAYATNDNSMNARTGFAQNVDSASQVNQFSMNETNGMESGRYSEENPRMSQSRKFSRQSVEVLEAAKNVGKEMSQQNQGNIRSGMDSTMEEQNGYMDNDQPQYSSNQTNKESPISYIVEEPNMNTHRRSFRANDSNMRRPGSFSQMKPEMGAYSPQNSNVQGKYAAQDPTLRAQNKMGQNGVGAATQGMDTQGRFNAGMSPIGGASSFGPQRAGVMGQSRFGSTPTNPMESQSIYGPTKVGVEGRSQYTTAEVANESRTKAFTQQQSMPEGEKQNQFTAQSQQAEQIGSFTNKRTSVDRQSTYQTPLQGNNPSFSKTRQTMGVQESFVAQEPQMENINKFGATTVQMEKQGKFSGASQMGRGQDQFGPQVQTSVGNNGFVDSKVMTEKQENIPPMQEEQRRTQEKFRNDQTIRNTGSSFAQGQTSNMTMQRGFGNREMAGRYQNASPMGQNKVPTEQPNNKESIIMGAQNVNNTGNTMGTDPRRMNGRFEATEVNATNQTVIAGQGQKMSDKAMMGGKDIQQLHKYNLREPREQFNIPKLLDEVHLYISQQDYKRAFNILANLVKYVESNKLFQNTEQIEYYSFDNLLEELVYKTRMKPARKVVNIKEKIAEIYLNYGSLLFELRRYQEARESLEKALRWNPVSTRILFELSEIHKNNRDFDLYVEVTEQCIKYAYRAADIARCYRNLGYFCIEKEEYEAAIALYYVSLEYERSNVNALSELEYISKKLNRKIVAPSYEEIQAIFKKHSIQLGVNKLVLQATTALAKQAVRDNAYEMAMFYYKIAYDVTQDQEIRKMLESLSRKTGRKI